VGVILALSAACASPRTGPPNVLLVSLDTFRADRLGGGYGNTRDLTPNLDAFASESVVFTRAYSQSTVTGPSHASMLTSRYPSEVAGTGRAPAIQPEMYTLPEVLGTYGYQTAARVAGGDLNPAIGPKKGFDSYESSVDFGSLYHTVPMAMSWLEQVDPSKPFFLFLHGYDTHATYLKPTPYGLLHTSLTTLTAAQQADLDSSELVVDGYLHPSFDILDAITKSSLRPRSNAGRARMAAMIASAPITFPAVPPEDQDLIRDAYDGAVSYADTQFGFLMARLQARHLLDDTVMVLMGDHGEALGEDGLFHRCCSLEDSVTHVPLMVRLPGGAKGGRTVDAVVELTDILPTVLELVGAQAPAGIKGMSLVPALEGHPFEGHRAALSQGGLGMRMVSARSRTGRLTYTGVQAVAHVLGDLLKTAQVPGPAFEATEGADAAEQAALRDEMVRWEATLYHSPVQSTVVIPDDLKAELRAHGYWDAR
jgi:arylsulfatase A-like enzyme